MVHYSWILIAILAVLFIAGGFAVRRFEKDSYFDGLVSIIYWLFVICLIAVFGGIFWW
jgi:hypothetical protein